MKKGYNNIGYNSQNINNKNQDPGKAYLLTNSNDKKQFEQIKSPEWTPKNINQIEQNNVKKPIEPNLKFDYKEISQKSNDKEEKRVELDRKQDFQEPKKKLENKAIEFIAKEEFANNYIPHYEKDEAINYYDIILCIDSLQNLTQGWKMKFNKDGYDRYKKQKDIDSRVVGIVRNGNKGKSFILQKLAGTKLPIGYSVNTEGLSIKYPVDATKNIILLDTAGLETPILIPKSLENENKQNKQNDASSFTSDKQSQILARDKQLTELFLQNFVITQSNILIIVFNILTYSDQKLFNRIKKDCKKKNQKLFVIHNLNAFVSKEQVRNYINNTLMISGTFTIEPMIMNNNDEDLLLDNTKNNTEFFIEKTAEKGNIIHFIMANEHSEAGKYYNDTTIKFLRKNCDTFTDVEKFPIAERIKEHLFYVSKDLMEDPIKSIDEIEIDEKETTIKLKKDKIVLKKCSVDELGFSNFEANAFHPKHAYYIQNNEFVIEIEVPGELISLNSSVDVYNECYIFTIQGVKHYEHTFDEKSHYNNTREKGNFSLDIKIPVADMHLKEKKAKNDLFYKNGLLKLFYSLLDSKPETQTFILPTTN